MARDKVTFLDDNLSIATCDWNYFQVDIYICILIDIECSPNHCYKNVCFTCLRSQLAVALLDVAHGHNGPQQQQLGQFDPSPPQRLAWSHQSAADESTAVAHHQQQQLRWHTGLSDSIINSIEIAAAASRYRPAVSTRETTSCDERSTSGLICQTCELMATCVMVDSAWMTVPVETCDTDEGYYCNVARRGCSNETGPCHPFGYVGNFACTSQGVFPDPYDCQKYHMCYNAASQPVVANIECGGNKAFSAATGDCSMGLNDTVCSRPQFTCSNSGDIAAWPGNANIFYICKATLERGQRILYPTLYRCASGEVFNGRDCMPRGRGNAPSGSDADKPAKPVPAPFRCPHNGLHIDPLDCRAYYYCDVLLRSKRHRCPDATHFVDSKKSCMRGPCPT